MTKSKGGPATGDDAPGGPADPHPSSSAAQGKAECAAIEELSRILGVALSPSPPLPPRRLPLDGAFVHVDGFYEGPPAILAEVFAHQGPLKGGQKHKLMSDAFKLVALSKGYPGARLMLVLTDDVAAAGAQVGWRGAALKALHVEIIAVPIPHDVAERVRVAQGRQRMVNDTGKGDP